MFQEFGFHFLLRSSMMLKDIISATDSQLSYWTIRSNR